MNRSRNLLRSVAASVVAGGLALASAVAAHPRDVNDLSRLRGAASSSRGVIVISPARSGAFACSAGEDGLRRAYGDAAAGPPLATVTLGPAAREVVPAGRDLRDAFAHGAELAGCEPEPFAMTLPPPGDPSAAPEPASWALLIAGVAMTGLAARRRRPAAVAG